MGTTAYALDSSSEKDQDTDKLEKRLWDAADQLGANSGLSSAQYSTPVIELIFLRFADVRLAKVRAGLQKIATSSRRGSRLDEPAAYHAEGVLCLTPTARFEKLSCTFPEGANAGKAINEAMGDIEKHNPQLAGVLPKTYAIFTSTLLKELLKRLSEIPAAGRKAPGLRYRASFWGIKSMSVSWRRMRRNRTMAGMEEGREHGQKRGQNRWD